MEQEAMTVMRRRVSGRCNFKDAMEPNPLVRWPNENILLCDGRRPSYDDLMQAQFVSGVLSTVQDINLPLYKNAISMNSKRLCNFPRQ